MFPAMALVLPAGRSMEWIGYSALALLVTSPMQANLEAQPNVRTQVSLFCTLLLQHVIKYHAGVDA